jgi:hypothetical protein
MKWTKMGTTVNQEVRATTYEAEGAPVTIESRKRQIPHASRPGTWEYTSYFVLHGGEEVAELHSLKDAKEYAEEHYGQN